jgi:hypothetical protein
MEEGAQGALYEGRSEDTDRLEGDTDADRYAVRTDENVRLDEEASGSGDYAKRRRDDRLVKRKHRPHEHDPYFWPHRPDYRHRPHHGPRPENDTEGEDADTEDEDEEANY